MSARPLSGRRILVTRPREQAERLARAIETAGGEALRHPTVEIAPPSDPDALGRIAGLLIHCDLAIFVSPTAVQEGLRVAGPWPAQLPAAAVGPGTKAALLQRGVANVLAPSSGADSDALLAEPAFGNLKGRRVLLFRGEGGRDPLVKALLARGAEVHLAECYRRVKPHAGLGPLAERWRRGGVDASTVFSAGALENLFELLPPAARALARATPLFASHERIGARARAHGVAEVMVCGPGDDEMLSGLLAYFGGRK